MVQRSGLGTILRCGNCYTPRLLRRGPQRVFIALCWFPYQAFMWAVLCCFPYELRFGNSIGASTTFDAQMHPSVLLLAVPTKPTKTVADSLHVPLLAEWSSSGQHIFTCYSDNNAVSTYFMGT